jgi:FKBP-type peptidyl-prolyl cis-trans isomerase
MKKIILYLLLIVFAGKANAQDGFQRTAKGTVYKLLSHYTGDRIKLNDVVTFEAIQKTEKDSVLFSTYVTGAPVQAQVQPEGDLMDIFPLLTVNDSVLIKVPTDSIFKGQENKRPPFLRKGSDLLFVIKVEKVQSLNEAIAERDKAIAEGKVLMERYKAEEIASTAKYITDHKLVFKTTASGLKYKITKPSVRRKPLPGDTLLVNYTGRTLLDGRVFDSSIAAEGTKAGLQRPADLYKPYEVVIGRGMVIPGWDEGLLLLNEGSKATFIIPSQLAYAERGGGEYIKPFSTLRFDVELVKVKPAKHTPVKGTAAKHVAVKPGAKTVTKKTAVKKK